MQAISPSMLAVLLAGSQPAPTSKEVLDARGGCYDMALVGRIVDTDGFVDLNDILPAHDESIWWGGVSSFLVRRDTQLVGRNPKLNWVKIVTSALPRRTAKVLLMMKAHASGVPIVVHWTMLRKGDPAQALADAPVERCP